MLLGNTAYFSVCMFLPSIHLLDAFRFTGDVGTRRRSIWHVQRRHFWPSPKEQHGGTSQLLFFNPATCIPWLQHQELLATEKQLSLHKQLLLSKYCFLALLCTPFIPAPFYIAEALSWLSNVSCTCFWSAAKNVRASVVSLCSRYISEMCVHLLIRNTFAKYALNPIHCLLPNVACVLNRPQTEENPQRDDWQVQERRDSCCVFPLPALACSTVPGGDEGDGNYRWFSFCHVIDLNIWIDHHVIHFNHSSL